MKFLDQLEKIRALTIQDLIDKIEGASLINEDSINVLEQFDNAVVLFMGAGEYSKITKCIFR